jgi:hypothetical protein
MDVLFHVGLHIAKSMGTKCVKAAMQDITKTTAVLARQMYVLAKMVIRFPVVLRSA